MITDEQRENALLFVLGLLEGEDRNLLFNEMKESAELRELVAEYRAVYSALTVSVEAAEPPVALRDSILAKIATQPEEIRGSFAAPTRFSKAAAAGWLVAACLAVTLLLLFQESERLRTERDTLASLADFEQLEIADLDAQTSELAEASARIAWSRTGGVGVIQLAQLPPTPEGRDYQLWIFEEGNDAPVSGGVFDPAAGPGIVFRPERGIAKAVAFAVSLEVEGGRPQPEGPVILLGKVAG